MTASLSAARVEPAPSLPPRVISVDALRGLVIFTMIFVNDLAGAPQSLVPDWMRHFHGKSGMTFVDLVFPAFLFIVGMSIPFALGSRLSRGEPLGRIIAHILARTSGLLLVGVMMVNETPDSGVMGWSGTLWSVLLYLAAIFAFSRISPHFTASSDAALIRRWKFVSSAVRIAGFATLVFLAFAFRGAKGQRIISLSPFSIHTEWYGILGLIGWAYLVGSLVFLLFKLHRTALLGSTVLLLSLYAADRSGAFQNFWLGRYVGIGGALGSQASITVAGILLGSILVGGDTITPRSRSRFTLLFIAGFSAGALLLQSLYGINKNSATPSWCLWSCAITAGLWLIFYFLCDVRRVSFIARPLAVAGSNVLLAYLLSEMLPAALDLTGLGAAYDAAARLSLALAIGRSVACAVLILWVTAFLNRFGFSVRL